MRRHEIKDDQWERVKHLLPGKAGDPGVTADNRLFINAVFWIGKTGAPWRDLPERFGKWNSVFQRFNRWSHKGVWQEVMEALSEEADLEWLLIDSTIIRAHQHAAGKKRTGKKGGKMTSNSVGRGAASAPKSTSPSMLWATPCDSS